MCWCVVSMYERESTMDGWRLERRMKSRYYCNNSTRSIYTLGANDGAEEGDVVAELGRRRERGQVVRRAAHADLRAREAGGREEGRV